MKPTSAQQPANALRQEAAHQLENRQHDKRLHHEHKDHHAHHKGHVFRTVRNPPKGPPALQRRQPRQRTPAAQQMEANSSEDALRLMTERAETQDSQRRTAPLEESSSQMEQNHSGRDDAEQAAYSWLRAKVSPERSGGAHRNASDSPEAALLQRAAAHPASAVPDDCDAALARALWHELGAQPASATARPAASALELGSTYLRIGLDPQRLGTLGQVRDVLMRARANTPAATAPVDHSEAAQNRRLLLPLVLLSLGRPRTPEQRDAALARRGNLMTSLNAMNQPAATLATSVAPTNPAAPRAQGNER